VNVSPKIRTIVEAALKKFSTENNSGIKVSVEFDQNPLSPYGQIDVCFESKKEEKELTRAVKSELLKDKRFFSDEDLLPVNCLKNGRPGFLINPVNFYKFSEL